MTYRATPVVLTNQKVKEIIYNSNNSNKLKRLGEGPAVVLKRGSLLEVHRWYFEGNYISFLSDDVVFFS